MVNLAGYRALETNDGFLTLFSESFQEACHSQSGARVETQTHYLKGTQIQKKLHQYPRLSVLEVGFGTGLGFEMTRNLAIEQNGQFNFLSLEIDASLAYWSFQRMGLIPQLESLDSGTILKSEGSNFSLKVLVGNARQTLSNYLSKSPQTFDAIYQDAFSPKRNPVLWTKEWFTLLKEYSKPDVILSTYSSSNSIRKSLLEAGWLLQKGEGFGAKRTSTRATLQGATDPDIIFQIKHSPAQTILDSQLAKELFL